MRGTGRTDHSDVSVYQDEKSAADQQPAFFIALSSCFLCEILDIGSIIAICYSTYNGLSAGVTSVICKLYLMSLALQGFQGFEYASSETLASGQRKWLRIVYRIIFILGELIIAFSGIGFFMDGRIWTIL